MATVKGTWVFSDVLSKPTWYEQEANFTYLTSSGTNRNAYRFIYNPSYDNTINAAGFCVRVDGAIIGFYSFAECVWSVYYVSTPFTVDFGSAEQEVSADFYAWLIANATPQASEEETEETAVAAITYKGETLETLNGGEYVTLHTKGQMMEDDIRVEVAEESGGASGDIAINGIVEQYKVNAGATVNAGDFVEFVNRYGGGTFDTIGISSVSACKLGDRVLVAYHNGGYVVNAVVLSFNGTNVEASQTFVVTESVGNPVRGVSVSALTDSKAIMACVLSPSGKHTVFVKVLEIDGATITAGEIKQIGTGSYHSITALTENKAILVYSSDTAYAVVLNIDGTDIVSYSKKLSDIPANYKYISITKLNENTALISSSGNLCVLSISGNSISANRYYATVTLSDYPTIVVGLSPNRAVFFYTNSSGSAIAEIVNIDGMTLSSNGGCVFTSNGTIYAACALSENKVILLYTGESDKYGKAIVVTVGDTITTGSFAALDYNDISCASVVAFSPNSALVTYGNGTGAFASLSIDGDTITADSAEIGTYVQPATSRLHNVGVAKTSGTEGQMVDVYCVGGESV